MPLPVSSPTPLSHRPTLVLGQLSVLPPDSGAVDLGVLDLWLILSSEDSTASEHPTISHLPQGHFAYWIRTSGTTSTTPSVVRVPHGCIVPNITSISKRIGLCSTDTLFLASSLTFDHPSIIDIFTALHVGASLVIVPDQIKLDPHVLTRVLFDNAHITVLMCTPSLLRRYA